MPESCEHAITLSGDLHARPAGALALAAARFSAAVSLRVNGRSADAKSVLAVMGLGATRGQRVTATAEGPDAEQAVAAVVAILAEATQVGALPEARVLQYPIQDREELVSSWQY